MKKIWLSVLLLTLSSLVINQASADELVDYAGAGLNITALNKNGKYGKEWGYGPSIFIGKGKIYSERYYLGGELGVGVNFYRKYKSDYGVNASLIPGVMLSQNTMFYGRLGIDAARVPHINTNFIGPVLGLGLQTKISNNWDVRGEVKNKGIGVGLVYKFD